MKKYPVSLYIFLIFMFVGCSSTQEGSKKNKKENGDNVNGFSPIDAESDGETSDFDEELEALMLTMPASVPYKEHQDQFKLEKDQEGNGLARETLSKSNATEIEKMSESQDPIDRGFALCELKQYSEGLKWLDQSYHKFKKHPPFWNAMGVCYLKQKLNRKALLYLNKALEINEQYAPAWNNLGVLYLQEEQDQKSLIAFEKAAGLNKFSQTPNYNLAFLYLQYGLVEKAEKLFLSLLQSSAHDQELKIGLAIGQLMLKKVESSIQSFNSLDTDLWDRPDVGINYSLALFMGNAKDRSRKVLSKVELSNDSRFSDYYHRVKKLIGEDDD